MNLHHPLRLALPFASALALALTLGAGTGCSRERAASAALSPDQAAAQVREILAIEDPIERLAQLAPVFPRIPAEAAPAILEIYKRAPLDGGDPELVLLGLWWARFDPQGAVRWTNTDWRAGYGAVLQAVYRSWAHVDPKAALGGARSNLHDPARRDLCIDAVVTGWDESGKPGLIQLVRSLPGLERQRIGELLARRRVISLGAEEALRWTESLKDPEFREIMARRVASSAAQAEPEVAARWAEPQIAAAERPTGLPRRIGTRWVRHDPIPAMNWLSTLPDNKDREDGVAESFRDWLSVDPPAATTWIEAQQMAKWNEPAFAIFAIARAQERPEAMLELVGRITDPALRDRSQVIILRSWFTNDGEAADRWLAAADVAPDVRTLAVQGRTLPLPDPDPSAARPPELGAGETP